MSDAPLRRELPLSFDAALEKLPAALQSEGFGVLTEIDVQATLKKELGRFRKPPYRTARSER